MKRTVILLFLAALAILFTSCATRQKATVKTETSKDSSYLHVDKSLITTTEHTVTELTDTGYAISSDVLIQRLFKVDTVIDLPDGTITFGINNGALKTKINKIPGKLKTVTDKTTTEHNNITDNTKVKDRLKNDTSNLQVTHTNTLAKGGSTAFIIIGLAIGLVIIIAGIYFIKKYPK